MNAQQLYQVIRAPHVSEKSTLIANKHNQFVFEVDKSASKQDIKQAVEKLFEVEVQSVQVLNVKGKVKRFGHTPGRRKNSKKAYVRLKPGQDIDFVEAKM